jgi:hypothetical protein
VEVDDSAWCGSVVNRNSAKFLWKSLPQQVKNAQPELAAVWRIGQCLWNRYYVGVYAAAQGFEWGPELAEFVSAFLGITLLFTVKDGITFFVCFH